MNVLLYSHTYLPKIGGREMVVYQLARALGELGHDVRVVGPRWDVNERNAPDYGIRVHRCPRFVRTITRSRYRRFPMLEEREMMLELALNVIVCGADVIHAHTTYPAGHVATLAKRWMPNVPVVITPHGIDINVIPPDYGMRLDPALDTKIVGALAAADAVTAISASIAASLAAAGAPAERIHRISNGTRLDRFAAPHAAGVREHFGLSPAAKIVLTVGNYHRRKGHEDLIRAMPQILGREPLAKLVIAGARTDPLRGLISEMGLGEAVVLTGPIATPAIGHEGGPDDLLAGLYVESSVYASAGIDSGSEGLSLALLDALSSGKPVVATRISGNEDVIEDGTNGFLVTPGVHAELADRITAMLGQPEAAARLGRQGRRRAQTLSWSAVAQRYLSVYEGAADRCRVGVSSA